MNKIIIVILLIIISLIAGIFIEHKTHVFEKFFKPGKDSVAAGTDSLALKWSKDFKLVEIRSQADGEIQKAYFYSSNSKDPQPLIVSLHSWSWNYQQEDTLSILSKEKNINYIHPDFRGVNNTKNACCSDLVIADIDAAIDYAIVNGNVDTSKIYVTGRSGGGYATLASFMKAKHRVKKFAAWVPLADLVKWYDQTKARKLKYTAEILLCTNSLHGELNKEVAIERSPMYWKTPVEKLDYATMDIYDGIYDGLETNSPIPITQSINFYNKLLNDLGATDSSAYISDSEKLKLLEYEKPLGDYGKIGGRDVCLVKKYKNLRIIFFTGGHEMLQQYAFDELMK